MQPVFCELSAVEGGLRVLGFVGPQLRRRVVDEHGARPGEGLHSVGELAGLAKHCEEVLALEDMDVARAHAHAQGVRLGQLLVQIMGEGEHGLHFSEGWRAAHAAVAPRLHVVDVVGGAQALCGDVEALHPVARLLQVLCGGAGGGEALDVHEEYCPVPPHAGYEFEAPCATCDLFELFACYRRAE